MRTRTLKLEVYYHMKGDVPVFHDFYCETGGKGQLQEQSLAFLIAQALSEMLK